MSQPIQKNKRAKSALPRNYTNIQLHACLDQAKEFKDQVKQHFTKSKFQNHVLNSAERVFCQQSTTLRPSSSVTSFNRKSKISSRSKYEALSTGYGMSTKIRNETNPEAIMSGLQFKTYRISQIKTGFNSGIEQKQYMKARIEQLKAKIVQQKNKKARTSLRNGKLMNAVQKSQFHISNHNQHSRRSNIKINQLKDQNNQLTYELNQVISHNNRLRQQNEGEDNTVRDLTDVVAKLRRDLDRERKLLQMWKQKQKVQYNQMTNKYMVMNQLKQEKAYLMNYIDTDVKNSH